MRDFITELRRRRVFRTAGIYVVGAWLLLQVADVLFPGWDLPDAAINVLFFAAVIGFPVALVFGWFYDVTTHGIVRTPSADEEGGDAPLPLQRRDYLILASLGIVAAVIAFDATREIVETPRVDESAAGPAERPDLAAKLPNSIAVLPFANISNDPDNEVFCDGVSEEILNKLGAFSDLNVIGRTSSFAFKGSDYRIPKISALLGAEYLLQGSVRKQGDRLRISAQLVDSTGAQRWSNTFDRNLEDIFAIQVEIADVVASTVVPQITAPQPSYQPKLDAYQHFLVGRELLRKRKDIRGEARRQLQKAIELDPAYAEAYAELAATYAIGIVTPEDAEKAEAAIQTALTLQPGMPRALAAQGLLLQELGDPAASETVLREVLEKDPNMVDALNWIGNALAMQCKPEEDMTRLERAARLDPLNGAIAVNIAGRFSRRGDYERAEHELLRLLEMPDPGLYPYIELRELYSDTGRLVDLNLIEKRRALEAGHHHSGLVLDYSLLGLWEQAMYWARRSEADSSHFWAPFITSYAYYLQGRFEDNLAEIDRVLAADGKTPAEMPGSFRLVYGDTQALAGDHAGAIRTLETVIDTAGPVCYQQLASWQTGALHALVWAYMEEGAPEKGRSLLQSFDRELQDLRRRGLLHRSEDLFFFAQNSLLLGQQDLALERLEQAIAAGWRNYYVHLADPRWAALRDDPRHQALMARVKADLDRQRVEVEKIDAEEDFIARLDRAQAAARQSGEE
ncbi:MAG: tetratricopeptide repeat protein [Gammaproteobacteria bacterium]|jgi:TolB-like protein/Tfp pilus assembly protein PilF